MIKVLFILSLNVFYLTGWRFADFLRHVQHTVTEQIEEGSQGDLDFQQGYHLEVLLIDQPVCLCSSRWI